jgi:hypothetical protein
LVLNAFAVHRRGFVVVGRLPNIRTFWRAPMGLSSAMAYPPPTAKSPGAQSTVDVAKLWGGRVTGKPRALETLPFTFLAQVP